VNEGNHDLEIILIHSMRINYNFLIDSAFSNAEFGFYTDVEVSILGLNF